MFPAVLADYHNAALGFQGDAAHGVAARAALRSLAVAAWQFAQRLSDAVDRNRRHPAPQWPCSAARRPGRKSTSCRTASIGRRPN
jgi:hypothetical protein